MHVKGKNFVPMSTTDMSYQRAISKVGALA